MYLLSCARPTSCKAQPPLQDAVNFPERCALLVERHCSALKDFTGEREEPVALDIGCAVGGAAFHLTQVRLHSSATQWGLHMQP